MTLHPNDFPASYGHGLLAALATASPAIVVTMADLWPAFAATCGDAHRVLFVPGIERDDLERLAAESAGATRVIGLGGGTAIDAAKYVAWKTGAALYSVPTVASVDACFTAPAAVRDGGRVKYEGAVRPAGVLIDFDVLATAPAAMNRVGIGDVLSIHTGTWDWRLGAAAGKTQAFDEAIATEAAAVLQRAMAHGAGLAEAKPEALTALFEGFRWVGLTERTVGHCRFEEGSEHYFAYTIEFQTGKRPPHGHLVCMGVQLMSELQGNDPDGIAAYLSRAGIDVRPQALGFTWDEVEAALRGLAAHARAEGYAYSVLDEVPIDDAFLARCRARLGA